MNQVVLTGRLVQDVELRQTTSGTSVCTITVAVTRTYKNADGEYDTDFFNVICWKSLADNCHKYLSKGKKIGVVGFLQNRNYKTAEGEKRYVTEIVANNIEFLSDKVNGNEQAETVPQESIQKQQPKKSIKEEPPIEDDDLPF